MATMLTAVPSAELTRSPQEPDPQVPERAHLRRFSAFYKQKILNEYEGLGKAGKGALLRREGLYSSLISEWRKQRDGGAQPERSTLRRPASSRPRSWSTRSSPLRRRASSTGCWRSCIPMPPYAPIRLPKGWAQPRGRPPTTIALTLVCQKKNPASANTPRPASNT